MLTRALLSLLVFTAACSEPVRVEWKYKLKAGSVSTPLVTDSYIAVGHEQGLTIVDLDGSPICTFDSKGEIISAPKTDGTLIFFGGVNYIFYAIDQNCQEKWKFAAADRIKSDPLVHKDVVYMTSYDNHIYALNIADGTAKWTFPQIKAIAPVEPEPEPQVAKPKKRGKKAKKKGKRGKRGKKAAKAAEPEPEPEAPAPVVPDVEPGDFSYSSPLIHDDVLYVGNLDGYLYAVNIADGSLRWRYKTEAAVTSTPIVENNVLYFGSNDGNVYALDIAETRVLWKLITKDWVNSSAVYQDGILYIGGNDRKVYAIESVSGRATWVTDIVGPGIARPAIFENLVFAAGGSGDGAVYAFQVHDGAPFWKYQTGGKIDSDPIIVGNRLYVSSRDGHLYCFSIDRTSDA